MLENIALVVDTQEAAVPREADVNDMALDIDVGKIKGMPIKKGRADNTETTGMFGTKITANVMVTQPINNILIPMDMTSLDSFFMTIR